METSNGEISKTNAKSGSRPRKLPRIPTDQEPYDVTKPPRKPPRLNSRPRRSSSPDFRRPKSSMHKKSNSLTEAQLSSVKLGEDTKNSCSAGQTSTTNSRENVPSPCHFSSNVVFNRRCGYCCQRIFPESEECLVAQFQVFHATCFRCAICNAGLDITNYCYLMHHGKFYCFQHCREVSEAEDGLGNEEKDIGEAGPGAFGAESIVTNVIYDERRRNQTLKKLVEFQHRRGKLEKVSLQLQETITTAGREDKLLLWKQWCDVSYEKTMVMRAVTELAYQLKEGELCEEQEQLQRKLRRLKKRRDEGTREENNEQEEKFLRCIFDVIEKRDLLLVELEIERRRDNAEVQKLKLQFEQTDTENENCQLHNVVQTNGQCLIL